MYFFSGISSPPHPPTPGCRDIQFGVSEGVTEINTIPLHLLSIRHRNDPPVLQTTKQSEVCVYCGKLVDSTTSRHCRSSLDMRVLQAAYGVRYSCSLPQSFSGQINPLRRTGLFYILLSSTVKTNSTSCPYSVFMCFGWISEQRAITFLNSAN